RRRGRGLTYRLAMMTAGLLLALVAVVSVLAVTGVWRPVGGSGRADLILHHVKRERLQLTITERGQLQAAENSDVVCRVKARSANSTVSTTIRWVVDDGTQVKRGDRLVQLDDSGLYEQLKAQKIVLDNNRASWVQADTNYAIVESQNASDIASARLKYEL